MNQILLVASHKPTIKSLQEVIEDREFDCSVASTQRRALYVVRHNPPDVVIVDNTSSRLSADKLTSGLRRLADVPVIAIVRNEEEAKTMSTAAVLTKPYPQQQLVSCIQRVLQKHPSELVVGPLRLNLRTRYVSTPHMPAPQRLTPKLFALLRALMLRAGQVVSREILMSEVWNTEFVEDTRTLDVHIHWIRSLIEPNPGHPIYLHTVRSVGYRLDLNDDYQPPVSMTAMAMNGSVPH